MRGDYSRLRFRASDHYSGVRLQQGRVQLDADWNEQVDIDAYRAEQTALDVIGPSGFPFEGGGFELGAGSYLRGISFHAAGEGLAVGEDATILASADGGATWSPMAAPAATGHLNGVHSLGSGDAWAVGAAGTILRLSGTPTAAWSAETGITDTDLNAVAFADADAGFAVGDRATILRHTSDGWSADTVPDTTANLRDVATLSAARAWIVGDGGTVLGRTADDTAWATQTAPAGTGDLNGVFFVQDGGTERGWAVGAGGTIITTADGGATWTPQTAPGGLTATLRDVRFTDVSSGVAVGDGGVILVTSDGGSQWQRVESPSGEANLLSLCMIGAPAHAAGDNAVLNATDGLFAWSTGTLPEPGRTITISAGDGYVDGLRAVNERSVSFSGQPGAPGAVLPTTDSAYAAYLRVVEQHVTAVEHEELREVALGGPDTTTRTQIAWSVVLHELGDTTCMAAEAARPRGEGGGRLRARSDPGQETAQECMVPVSGGYRRLENQLYRVEIFDASAASGNGNGGAPEAGATFTWSRDNGSVAMRLVALDGANKAVTVSGIPDDEVLGLAPQQWIEISDDTRALSGRRGLLAQIKSIEGDVVEVESFEPRPGGGDWTLADFPLRPTVRRWDGKNDVGADWTELEAGVFVQFDGGHYEPRDYWTIPARTLTGDVDWRRSGPVPLFDDRQGEVVRWATLGLVERAGDGTWSVLHDCRRLFPWLTGLVRAYYVSGDGQEAMPDLTHPEQRVELPAPLEVGVANGRYAVPGAPIRFRIVQNADGATANGRLTSGLGGTQTISDGDIIVPTGPDGIASCRWELDGAVQWQRVEAALVDELGADIQSPIRFDAGRSIAAEVAYDPATCSNFAQAKDVQTALDTLVHRAWIDYAEGADQEVLGQGEVTPLRVRVVSACGAVAGAQVDFAPVGASGSVSPTTATTDANGFAQTQWTLGTGSTMQFVDATLVSGGGVAANPAPRVRFGANLSRADHVAFNARPNCGPVAKATTVQQALDNLIDAPRLYPVSGDGVEAAPGSTVEVSARLWSLCGPIDGQVRFEVVSGDAVLTGANPAPAEQPDGVARIDVRVGGDARQVIRASVVNPADAAHDLAVAPVVFTIGAAAGGGACTVSVAPGSDIAAALAALPDEGGQICFAGGTYELDGPVVIDNRRRLVVAGRGPSTVLRAQKADIALLFRGCADVTVRDLRVESGSPGIEAPHRDGGLTFLGCTDVKVTDCQLACADGPERARACLTIRPTTPEEEPFDAGPIRADVERNRFEVGAWQVGALVIGSARLTVARNDLRPGPAPRGTPDYAGFLAPELRQSMMAATVKPDTQGAQPIKFPGRNDASIWVLETSPFFKLWSEVATRSDPRPAVPLPRAIETGLRTIDREPLSAEAMKTVGQLVRTLIAVEQGIVVGGAAAGTVQVLDNVIDGAIQGIRVGVGTRAGERPLIGEAIVSRNVVHARVPAAWSRARHGVLVSNARSTTITDTVATVARPGQAQEPTEVEGIRVQGTLGPFMLVRQSSLEGYTIGIRVQPAAGTGDRSQMWYVAETMARGSRTALDAPATVARDRNFS